MDEKHGPISNTPYDDVFRTLLADCGRLIIPLINLAFHEHYDQDSEIEQEQNEYFLNRQDGKQEERITDSCFRIKGIPGKRYHIECQSTADNSIAVRMFEYDSQIALMHHRIENGVLTVTFPESAVLYLRHNSTTPDQLTVRILTKGGEFSYQIPTIKVQNFSLDDILEGQMLFLIPFYIFRYEKQFSEIELHDDKMKVLIQDYRRIQQYLTHQCESEAIDTYTKTTLTEMTRKVVENLAAKNPAIQKGVVSVMGGKILDYEAKRIKQSGIEEGREEGREAAWLESTKNIMNRLHATADQALEMVGVPELLRPKLKKML